MKRISLILISVLAVFVSITPAQQTAPPAKTEAAKPDTPTLTAEKKDALHTIDLQMQSNLLQQYQNRDRYNAAQDALTEQSKKLSAQREALVESYQKDVDSTKWIFDRGTEAYVPAKAPAPAPPVQTPAK